MFPFFCFKYLVVVFNVNWKKTASNACARQKSKVTTLKTIKKKNIVTEHTKINDKRGKLTTMGCGRSKGKIYLAANENIVKAHSATLQETELSMEEGATLLHIFSTMELETAKENAPMGVVGISFAAFSSKLAIKTSKFALNIFAAGCGLPAGVFPEQKLAGRMDSHQFLKCITYHRLVCENRCGIKKICF